MPHVGWNEVYPLIEYPMFANIPGGADFYFLHSHHLVATKQGQLAAYILYCLRTATAVAAGDVRGVQFYSEKNSRAGSQLLRNFLAM